MFSNRKPNFITSWIIIIAFATTFVHVTAHFYGGSLSYKLELVNGKKYAHVELITGWALKHGPCGATCTRASVGSSTRATRLLMEQTNGKAYFGTFETDVASKDKRNLTNIVQTNFTETVYAVDASGQWEQDVMKFTFDLENDQFDLNFDGKSWREILLITGIVSSNTPWHLQNPIRADVRSDTNALNSVPRIISKPVYRAKLDSKTEIRIISIDPDGDYVKCTLTDLKAGGLENAKGVDVTEDCRVIIYATSIIGYSNNAWVPVAVKLLDYNRKSMTFGTDDLLPIDTSLAYSTVQFLINILIEINVPTFIEPTLENGHAFIIYAGATWNADIYAQAADNKSKIVEFNMVNLDQEKFIMSSIKDGSVQGVKYVEVTWETSEADIGHHLICFSAIDDKGVDSEYRCFKLEVRENTMYSTTQGGSAYFIKAPGPNQQLSCEADVTCLLPIYVRSPREVRTINVGESYTQESSISKVQTIPYNGATAYKATLSFSDPSSNFEPICFNALSDKQETLASTCIKTAIQSKDPCESSPCQNSAECISDRRTGSFICNCTAYHAGKFCQTNTSPCDLNPCVNGKCYFPHHRLYCDCRHTGFTGKYCETNINDCEPTFCNNSGICKDKIQSYDCDCHSRYEGSEPTDCAADKCGGENKDNLTCQADSCPVDVCNGHGVCSNTDQCTCMYGYSNHTNCTTSTGDLPVTGVEFLRSSPKDGELQTCFMNDTIVDCQISVYLIAISGSEPPDVTFQTKTEIRSLVTFGSIQSSQNFKGITNVYSITATIKGSLSENEDQYICFTAKTGTSDATVCLQLDFVSDPLLIPTSIASMQIHPTVKFVPPTLNDGSKLVCNSTERCMLLMFTEAKGSVCQDVLSPTKGVTVFPTRLDSGVCVTEVAYQFSDSSANKTEICFQSSKTNFQQRCYEAEIPSPACRSAPCQNGGHCFRNRKRNAVEDIQCICNNGYTGDRCEKGPCPVNNCLNDAYCLINNGTETCLCKAGFYGQKCELTRNPSPIFKTSFTSTARLSSFQCVQYQTCSFSIIAEGTNVDQRPNVIAGYVSPYIQLDDISIVPMKDVDGHLVNVVFESAKEGAQDICIQTLDESGQNLDEVCIEVIVITDVSFIYGFKDRPHFVQPSLPANAHLTCIEGEQCHVLYHVTSGEGKESEGVSVTVKESGDFEQFYLHSSCATSGKNCTVDISLSPGTHDVGPKKQICIGTSLTSSNIEGEERCFNLTTLPSNELKGCQTLHCKNGGFCDGHKAYNPVCYCQLSFSGKECDRPISTKSTTFLGDLSIPSDIQCVVGEECSIPFETVIVQNDTTDLSFTYVDSRVSSYSLTCEITEYSDTVYMGVTTFKATEIGTYKACIQSNDTNIAEIDEFCLLINAVNGSSSEQTVDMTKPHFVSPTLPGESTVLCSTNKTCHVDLHFINGNKYENPEKCPTVIDTSSNKDGRKHIFSPRYDGTACESDIVYIPPTTPITGQVCVQLALPGKKGEIRCFTIKVVDDAPKEKTSACIGGSCSSTGTCEDGQIPSPMKDNCKCRMKGKQGPSEDAASGGVPIAMIAGVGGGVVACTGTIAAIAICKKMKKPKIDAVNDLNDDKGNTQEQQKELPSKTQQRT